MIVGCCCSHHHRQPVADLVVRVVLIVRQGTGPLLPGQLVQVVVLVVYRRLYAGTVRLQDVLGHLGARAVLAPVGRVVLVREGGDDGLVGFLVLQCLQPTPFGISILLVVAILRVRAVRVLHLLQHADRPVGVGGDAVVPIGQVPEQAPVGVVVGCHAAEVVGHLRAPVVPVVLVCDVRIIRLGDLRQPAQPLVEILARRQMEAQHLAGRPYEHVRHPHTACKRKDACVHIHLLRSRHRYGTG